MIVPQSRCWVCERGVTFCLIPTPREHTINGVDQVKCLDVSFHSTDSDSFCLGINQLKTIGRLFPKLQSVDLSYTHFKVTQPERALSSLAPCRSTLTQITWTGCKTPYYCGNTFSGFPMLTHLYLDEAVLSYYQHANFEINIVNPEAVLFLECKRLECLSMKGSFYAKYHSGITPLTQDMLINMVRRHSTLRWLRSDLTAENVAMLKRERPDFTFVSD